MVLLQIVEHFSKSILLCSLGQVETDAADDANNTDRKISLFNHEIVVPNVPLREEVEVHLIPNVERGALEIRIWWENQMV
jgi:hypothetical protein